MCAYMWQELFCCEGIAVPALEAVVPPSKSNYPEGGAGREKQPDWLLKLGVFTLVQCLCNSVSAHPQASNTALASGTIGFNDRSINQSILFQKYTSNKNKWIVLLNSSLGPWSQNDLEDARPMSIKNWLKNLYFFFLSYATKTFANVIE